jgi:hypothetical protein
MIDALVLTLGSLLLVLAGTALVLGADRFGR